MGVVCNVLSMAKELKTIKEATYLSKFHNTRVQSSGILGDEEAPKPFFFVEEIFVDFCSFSSVR